MCLEPGEWIGFYNTEAKGEVNPFLLMKIGKGGLKKGCGYLYGYLSLVHDSKKLPKNKDKGWKIHVDGNVIALWPPWKKEDFIVPNTSCYDGLYLFTEAYVGKKEIIKALNKKRGWSPGFKIYSLCF